MRRWDKRFIFMGLTALIVCILAISFNQLLTNLDSVKEFFSKITSGLYSLILGLFIAYLINPIMAFFEHRIFKPIGKKLAEKISLIHDKERFTFKFGRIFGLIFAFAFFISLMWDFFWLIIPQIYNSILTISEDIPEYVVTVQTWFTNVLKNNTEQVQWINNIVDQATDFILNFINNDLIPKMGDFLKSVSSGVIVGVKFVLNFVVGMIIAVYVLFDKELLAARFKKIFYSMFSLKRANAILHSLRKSDAIFGGFISGKIIDSLIIGLICYVLMLIFDMPYPVLIAVIIGVTNVIPFFGPFFGAAPSAVIILMSSPKQLLLFAIIIFCLQQFDGNILGPMIMGDSTGVSALWIIVAISIGGSMFGVLGMFLGVPVFACLYAFTRYVVCNILKMRGLPITSEEYVDIESIDTVTKEIHHFDREHPDYGKTRSALEQQKRKAIKKARKNAKKAKREELKNEDKNN
ncbi:MAG: AI-2E family transporter [Lachnospiraceae bacterium]|nr:AI-2E family transporter [Lachnospiraceae bacterium]